MYDVSVLEVCNSFGLKNLAPSIDVSKCKIHHARINRPALQLTGFFDYFDSERMQIIGMVEYTYLERMEADKRRDVLHKLFSCDIPCLVLCHNLEPFPEMLEFAVEYNVPLLLNEGSTTEFIGEIIPWFKVELAPRITMHGVLMDVYGEGILICGESGIGKSEMALELIKRGHRLVADDAVEIRRVSDKTLYGTCPEIIRYFIEVRGIGIIDVRQTFGVQAVKETQTIDLMMKLEMWDQKKIYDRLGLTAEYTQILGNSVEVQTIPIRPGRNLAMIGEAAAVNHRQKKMGYSAAQVLTEKLEKRMT